MNIFTCSRFITSLFCGAREYLTAGTLVAIMVFCFNIMLPYSPRQDGGGNIHDETTTAGMAYQGFISGVPAIVHRLDDHYFPEQRGLRNMWLNVFTIGPLVAGAEPSQRLTAARHTSLLVASLSAGLWVIASLLVINACRTETGIPARITVVAAKVFSIGAIGALFCLHADFAYVSNSARIDAFSLFFTSLGGVFLTMYFVGQVRAGLVGLSGTLVTGAFSHLITVPILLLYLCLAGLNAVVFDRGIRETRLAASAVLAPVMLIPVLALILNISVPSILGDETNRLLPQQHYSTAHFLRDAYGNEHIDRAGKRIRQITDMLTGRAPLLSGKSAFSSNRLDQRHITGIIRVALLAILALLVVTLYLARKNSGEYRLRLGQLLAAGLGVLGVAVFAFSGFVRSTYIPFILAGIFFPVLLLSGPGRRAPIVIAFTSILLVLAALAGASGRENLLHPLLRTANSANSGHEIKYSHYRNLIDYLDTLPQSEARYIATVEHMLAVLSTNRHRFVRLVAPREEGYENPEQMTRFFRFFVTYPVRYLVMTEHGHKWNQEFIGGYRETMIDFTPGQSEYVVERAGFRVRLKLAFTTSHGRGLRRAFRYAQGRSTPLHLYEVHVDQVNTASLQSGAGWSGH